MFSLKKIVMSSCIFALLSTASLSYTQGNGTIVGNNVNVRKEANTKSSILFKLQKNKSVKVLDKKENWYKISYNNKIGWVSDDFVKNIDSTSQTSKKTSESNSESIKTDKKITTEYEIKINANNVNIRSKASANSTIIAKAKLNQKVIVVAVENDWTKIKINDKYGWINNKFLEKENQNTNANTNKTTTIQPINGVINGRNINVRKEPSTKASIITTVSNGKTVKILEVNKDWTKISIADISGWISSKYITKENKSVSRSDNTLRDTRNLPNNQDLANKIIETGKNYIGTNYVYGGTTPKGFDCSGFTGYIMQKHGISLPRTSVEQATVGQYVSRDSLKPGDLVFFDTNGGKNRISHVGMYIGNNNFIHASSGGAKEVRISSLSERFYSSTYMTARRVIK